VVNIAGLIVSIIARNQIKRTGERGGTLALWGIIISIVSLVFTVIYVIVVIAAVGTAVQNGSIG